MDRPDPGDLELPERLVEAGPGQLAPEAHAEVGGRLLGERDGRDLGEARPPAPDEVHDAAQEQRGLPAAGRRLDEERGVEVLDRAAALVAVDEQRGRIAEIGGVPARRARCGHSIASSVSWATTAGSARLASAQRARSAPHARSKAHGPRAQAPGRWKNRPGPDAADDRGEHPVEVGAARRPARPG